MSGRRKSRRPYAFRQICRVFEEYLDPECEPVRVSRIQRVPNCAQGLYVGVRSKRICYVGSVSRRKGGIRSRLQSHHKRPDTWNEIWVFPFKSTIAEPSVRACEMALIHVFDPAENVVGKAA